MLQVSFSVVTLLAQLGWVPVKVFCTGISEEKTEEALATLPKFTWKMNVGMDTEIDIEMEVSSNKLSGYGNSNQSTCRFDCH